MIIASAVRFRYPGAQQAALDGIDLTVNRGELFGLLGPNGAGKTTLISLLTGLRRADAGSVFYDELDIADHRATIQKRISWVPQEYAFYPSMTVFENLRFFAGVVGLRGKALDQRIQAVTAIAGLENAGSKRAVQFSGGMKRRLNVAISLLGDPDYLFLDEPTVGIDPQSRHFILEAIRRINEGGTTVIYSSHYMEEVEALCDRIAIVDQGRILTSGSLTELLGNDGPGASRSAVSITLDRPFPAAPELSPGFRLSDDGLTLSAETVDAGLLAEQLQSLAKAGLQPARIQSGTGNLEQLFLSLTQRSLRD